MKHKIIKNKITPFDFGNYVHAKNSSVFISRLQRGPLMNSKVC